jgi:hypothetical protein
MLVIDCMTIMFSEPNTSMNAYINTIKTISSIEIYSNYYWFLIPTLVIKSRIFSILEVLSINFKLILNMNAKV